MSKFVQRMSWRPAFLVALALMATSINVAQAKNIKNSSPNFVSNSSRLMNMIFTASSNLHT